MSKQKSATRSKQLNILVVCNKKKNALFFKGRSILLFAHIDKTYYPRQANNSKTDRFIIPSQKNIYDATINQLENND